LEQSILGLAFEMVCKSFIGVFSGFSSSNISYGELLAIKHSTDVAPFFELLEEIPSESHEEGQSPQVLRGKSPRPCVKTVGGLFAVDLDPSGFAILRERFQDHYFL
jgi:hypothetical protein